MLFILLIVQDEPKQKKRKKSSRDAASFFLDNEAEVDEDEDEDEAEEAEGFYKEVYSNLTTKKRVLWNLLHQKLFHKTEVFTEERRKLI